MKLIHYFLTTNSVHPQSNIWTFNPPPALCDRAMLENVNSTNENKCY